MQFIQEKENAEWHEGYLTAGGIEVSDAYFYESTSILPEDITPRHLLCCDCLGPDCICAFAAWRIDWNEAKRESIIVDNIQVNELYHPDTISTCRNCVYYATYKCKPLRASLWDNIKMNQPYTSIASCRHFKHYKDADNETVASYVTSPSVKKQDDRKVL